VRAVTEALNAARDLFRIAVLNRYPEGRLNLSDLLLDLNSLSLTSNYQTSGAASGETAIDLEHTPLFSPDARNLRALGTDNERPTHRRRL
jgi:hypothetical protein